VCFLADVGQEEDFKAAEEKALKIGASKMIVTDLKKEFVVRIATFSSRCNNSAYPPPRRNSASQPSKPMPSLKAATFSVPLSPAPSSLVPKCALLSRKAALRSLTAARVKVMTKSGLSLHSTRFSLASRLLRPGGIRSSSSASREGMTCLIMRRRWVFLSLLPRYVCCASRVVSHYFGMAAVSTQACRRIVLMPLRIHMIVHETYVSRA
jgi:uncharacterized protein YodC (DUF2158 family)